MSDEDQVLLQAARAGDRAALEALLARHEARIYRYGMKMCRDPEAAKDVLQDTLLAMARGVRDFRGASSISTWLYTIARSFCLKQRRKQKAARPVDRSFDANGAAAGAPLVDPARSPDEELASKEVARAIDQAIGELDPAHREVLILRDVEGLRAAEVAEVLGVSVDAVKSRLHRARLALRERAAPLLGIPDPQPSGAAACPDVLQLYSQHLEGDISADLCADMEQHLRTCTRCRSACDSLKRTLALCVSSPSQEVPRPVQDSVRAALRAFLTQRAR
jgi:RNA polymerase sigma-70 factor (ECF subfamily)